MSLQFPRRTYADLYGPTTGDRIRLADTELIIEIEKDFTVYGDEITFGGGKVIRVRDDYIPFVSIGKKQEKNEIVVLLESEGKKLALAVDELVGQQQVVIKSLESNYKKIKGISGATILGDGRVALILDVVEQLRMHGMRLSEKNVAKGEFNE